MKKLLIKTIIILALLLAIALTSIDAFAISQNDADAKAKADRYLAMSWDLENGGLKDTADFYWVDLAEEQISKIEWMALKKDLAAVAHATRVELDKQTDRSSGGFVYFGNCRITAYCPCAKCCGKWAGGPTASGSMPAEGVTVANGSLPFGTKVRIDGHVYTVQDRGVGADQFDIYMDSHNACNLFGMQYMDVYVEE